MGDVQRLGRLIGLLAGTAALVRWVWSARRLPFPERLTTFRRELAPSVGPRGATAVCAIAGVLTVAMSIATSVADGSANLSVDSRWIEGSILAFLATIVVKLALVVAEEAIFRTAVIRTIAPFAGAGLAVCIGAGLFALAHGRDVTSTAILAADGVGFGVAYVATGSLRAPVAWHAAKNLAVWLLVGESTMQLARGPARLTYAGGPSGTAAVDLAVTLVVVALTCVWFRQARRPRNTPLGLPTRPV